MAPKSTTLLFMIISTLLLSVCTLDGHRILIENSVAGTGLSEDEEVSYVHSRMLAVRTNDYQNYDPSPAFVKPPYKLIPN
ncbi:uncharacterized protein LOC110023772 isoform X4 [Phalaenopsis equestris]|uniref:uncharacterized protein LOC110023772 isoform X4 n=1 Tax=Phalaenopsis equestris TaxID=78828 RepID=UPI0009E27E5E|nr:uncharacterized protein LOC110023772 isoform X4 [Phalaenopsis equestris]